MAIYTRSRCRAEGVNLPADIGSHYPAVRTRRPKPPNLLLESVRRDYLEELLSLMPFPDLHRLSRTSRFWRSTIQLHIAIAWRSSIGSWMNADRMMKLQQDTGAFIGGMHLGLFLAGLPATRPSLDIYLKHQHRTTYRNALRDEGYTLIRIATYDDFGNINLHAIEHWRREKRGAGGLEIRRVNLMVVQSDSMPLRSILAESTTFTTSFATSDSIQVLYPTLTFSKRALTIGTWQEVEWSVEAAVEARRMTVLARLQDIGVDVQHSFLWPDEACREACGSLTRKMNDARGAVFSLRRPCDAHDGGGDLVRIPAPSTHQVMWCLSNRCINPQCTRFGTVMYVMLHQQCAQSELTRRITG